MAINPSREILPLDSMNASVCVRVLAYGKDCQVQEGKGEKHRKALFFFFVAVVSWFVSVYDTSESHLLTSSSCSQGRECVCPLMP